MSTESAASPTITTPATIPFTLDGRALDARPGETILAAAARHGIAIPHLCAADGLAPAGNCRPCVVAIDGERALAPACCRTPTAGMQVQLDSERVRRSQRLVLELLAAETAGAVQKPDSELLHWQQALGVTSTRFAARMQPQERHEPQAQPLVDQATRLAVRDGASAEPHHRGDPPRQHDGAG